MGDWKKALKEFLSKDTSAFTYDEKMEISYYMGLCYTKLRKYEEAIVYLEQVITSSGDILRIFQCRMTLAYIYVITKRVKMAEFELNRLESSGFESPLLYNTLAYVSYVQKQNTNAIEYYEKTLEIDSNNTTALNSIGYILADSGVDVVRALRFCRRAVDLRPQCAAYLDSLGWAYYKNGDIPEGKTYLKRALDIAPEIEDIRRHYRIVTGDKP
jgi:tetratricopeptide (TPR) repeat protein